MDVNQFRRCSRPGCGKPAVATLTYAYAHSTAVVGPLAPNSDPHSWDLCEFHASKITAPLGWELLRVDAVDDDDEDLTALAEAVREAGRTTSGLIDSNQDFGVNHPVHRAQRKQVSKNTRRGHLSVVPDPEDDY
ncbi:DUF3499 domain-containing protein [Corynebacterium ulcerans]|uniref:Protein of uncharacterized function (DUF3499) n=2 Tax=Corynebacterium ulcerans TaxID=65058 RepID=A0ABD0BIM3_CORUL|nr:DUF3499 domain-containing protein [Corynebacterium ulcerans]AEG81098.1 hypothetical protein CULC809_00558 [Corynebacterium ulcerans 809]AEG83281.1 hypothetical protein CULC22_00565 [Corynebacterium ulcerans BR-AD22]AIT88551.1 Hypothetical protein Cul210932_0587 [Corynebacterium ulcerans]AIU29925.1 Hypothetical protein Cul210931_0564 [Corynebacterium ulcerans]AIU91186.1 Hypothetical protein Cul05146_0601 [Corynebacterium ulcerans]